MVRSDDEAPSRPAGLVPVAVAAVGLTALVGAQMTLTRSHIEHDLTTRSRDALRQAGLSGFDVVVSGRDVTLTGHAAPPGEIAHAVRLVSAQEGVRVVTVTVAAASPPAAGGLPITAPTIPAPATPAPSGAPPAVTAMDRVRAQLAALPRITFDSRLSTPTQRSRATIRAVARIMAANPGVRVRLDGFTDDVGSRRVNRELSAARAAVVRLDLIIDGVDPARLQAVGHGSAQPAAPNTTAANRAINRRVTVTVLG